MSHRSTNEPVHRPTPLPTYSSGPPTHAPDARDSTLGHARAVIALVFGPIATRTFDVRYGDGSVERGQMAATAFRFGVNRPGALRRMLLPPSELSIVESYLSGDVDIDGELESAMGLSEEIGARVRSPRVLARLVRHLLALPGRDATGDVRPARRRRSPASASRRPVSSIAAAWRSATIARSRRMSGSTASRASA